MDMWDAVGLKASCVLSGVGAGGKTSLLLSLAAGALRRRVPVILTATTKMYRRQVSAFQPIITSVWDDGSRETGNHLRRQGCAAWFAAEEGGKVIGLPPAYVDELNMLFPEAVVLVEADGAREKWLKAPGLHEPVIPPSTQITAGILSLQALQRPLTDATVHRLDMVCALLGKKPGDIITAGDLAALAGADEGLFRNSRGRRILILAGSSDVNPSAGHEVVKQLRQPSGINCCIITRGYGESMQPCEVIGL